MPPRPMLYDPETDPEYGDALQRYNANEALMQPMAPEPLPTLDSTNAASTSWLHDFRNPAPQTQTPLAQRLMNLMPVEEMPGDLNTFGQPRLPAGDGGAMERHFMDMGAKASRPTAKALPLSDPKKRGPMVSVPPGKATTPRGPKTQLALHFARVMGMESPGEPDSPEDLAFAKAAHVAMLKMSKGQSVARFLSSMNSAKASATFRTLMDAELAKTAPKQPAAPATGAPR